MTHVFSSFSLPALVKPKISFHSLNTIFALSVASYALVASPYAKWLCLPISLKSENIEDIAQLRTLCTEAFSAIYLQMLTPTSSARQGGYAPASLPLTSHLHPLHLRLHANSSPFQAPDKDVSVFPHTYSPSPMKGFYSFHGNSKSDFLSPEGAPPDFSVSSPESLSSSSSNEVLTFSYAGLLSVHSDKRSFPSASHSFVSAQPVSGSPEQSVHFLVSKEVRPADSDLESVTSLPATLEAPTLVTIQLAVPSIAVPLDDSPEGTVISRSSLPQGKEKNEAQTEGSAIISKQSAHLNEDQLLRWDQYMSHVKNHNNRIIRDWLMKAALNSNVKPEEIPFRIGLIKTILKFQDYINLDWEDAETREDVVKLREKFPTNHAGKDPNDPKMEIAIGEMRREFHYEYLKTVDWSKTSHGKLFLTPELEFENNFHGVVLNAYKDGYDFPKNLGINAYYDEDIHD